MTDSQQTQPAASPSRKRLEGAFSTDIVNAIVGVAREEATAILEGAMTDLSGLVAQHRETIQAARDLPPAERAQVTSQVDDATAEVSAVAKQANEQAARREAGEPIEPEEAKDTKKGVDKAGDKVAEAKTAVDERTSRHEAILAPREGSDKDNRLENIEGDVASLGARVDQISSQSRDADARSIRAIAIARASASSGHAFKRATFWWVITFMVVGFLYWLVFTITDLDWTVSDQFAWPFGLASMVGCVVAVFARDSQSRAEAEVHSDDGLDVLGDRHDDDRDHGRSAQASAHASAQ